MELFLHAVLYKIQVMEIFNWFNSRCNGVHDHIHVYFTRLTGCIKKANPQIKVLKLGLYIDIYIDSLIFSDSKKMD